MVRTKAKSKLMLVWMAHHSKKSALFKKNTGKCKCNVRSVDNNENSYRRKIIHELYRHTQQECINL